MDRTVAIFWTPAPTWTLRSINFGREVIYGPYGPFWKKIFKSIYGPYGPFVNSRTAYIWNVCLIFELYELHAGEDRPPGGGAGEVAWAPAAAAMVSAQASVVGPA